VASLGGEGSSSSSGLYVTPLSAASFVRELEVIASRLPNGGLSVVDDGGEVRCLDGDQDSWPDVLTERRVEEATRLGSSVRRWREMVCK
jgi:hypothetical protein